MDNARMTPNPAHPMLLQCQEKCKDWNYFATEDGTACYCGRGTLLASLQLPDDERCAICPDLPGAHCGKIGAREGSMAVYLLRETHYASHKSFTTCIPLAVWWWIYGIYVPRSRYAQPGYCPSGRSAGWDFTAAFVGAALLYLAVGSAMEHQRTGAKGIQALPHLERWRQLAGLVYDGVEFAKGSGGRGRSGGSGREYRSLPEAERQPSGRTREKESKKESKKSSSSSSSSKARSPSKVERKKEARVSEPEPETLLQSSAAAAVALPGTASAGGGRWVHVPT